MSFYKTLLDFKEFLKEAISDVEMKRIYQDELENEIYRRVQPEIFIFDGLISYDETKMPYINIIANSQSTNMYKNIEITLQILVKNEGIYKYKYDEEGNILNDYDVTPNDSEVWMDAIGLAEKIERDILNLETDKRKFLLSDTTPIEINPSTQEGIGDGIAQVDLKFTIQLPPREHINNNFLQDF